jgi:hypothetical protein
VIGQPVEPGPELMLPVRLNLIDNLGVPVDVHPKMVDVGEPRSAGLLPRLLTCGPHRADTGVAVREVTNWRN